VTALPGPALCVLLAASVFAAVPPPDGLRAGLALLALVESLRMTRAPRLSATALLVPLVAVLVGGQHRRSQLSCPQGVGRQWQVSTERYLASCD